MELKRISKNDLFGRFYIKKPNGAKWDAYYKTIDALRSLFQDHEFTEIINGFYLNIWENFDSVRVSYFVDSANSDKAVSKFKKFIQENELIEIKSKESPRRTILASEYGGEEYEERFRNFLILETQIGLDLIKNNLLNARILFATYRWRARKASLSFKQHFESTFERDSPTYNALTDDEIEQFFKDLEEWPNPPQVDWAHFMVNFVLGCDWNNVFSDPNYLSPGNPKSIPEINEIIQNSGLGFQIPFDWKP